MGSLFVNSPTGEDSPLNKIVENLKIDLSIAETHGMLGVIQLPELQFLGRLLAADLLDLFPRRILKFPRPDPANLPKHFQSGSRRCLDIQPPTNDQHFQHPVSILEHIFQSSTAALSAVILRCVPLIKKFLIMKLNLILLEILIPIRCLQFFATLCWVHVKIVMF
jgi:hypothetical protein